MKFDENELKELCEKYGFQYHLTSTHATIKTLYASWMFEFSNIPYKLFHRPIVLHNYKVSINNNHGFHDQKRSFENLSDMIDYIYTHDKDFFIKRPYLPKKKKKK